MSTTPARPFPPSDAPRHAGRPPAPAARDWQPLGDGVVLALYALLALILFGLPVIGHLKSRIIVTDEIDSSQFMWFFAWWPHALLNGLNPLVTHLMFVPDGLNVQ